MATSLQMQPIPLPLKLDKTGVARVGGTRVTLDTVVRAFARGATAEEIAQQYPSLSLSDVYATISYYLQNREEVEKYLEKRAKYAQAVKRENQERFDQSGIRERLLARKGSHSRAKLSTFFRSSPAAGLKIDSDRNNPKD
jgi:uncharacterized protein (DUF433 family)